MMLDTQSAVTQAQAKLYLACVTKRRPVLQLRTARRGKMFFNYNLEYTTEISCFCFCFDKVLLRRKNNILMRIFFF